MSTARQGRRVAAVSEARGLKLLSIGREGKTLRLVSAELDGFGQILVVEHDGKRHQRAPAVGRRLPGLQRAGRGRTGDGDRRERRDRPADAGRAARRARTARSCRHRKRRRSDLHRLCPHARCACQGARRASPLCREPPASSSSAAAATATRASGPRWERLPSPRPILPSSPTTIRAAKFRPPSAARY